MVSISVRNAGVEFAIYNARGRSLRNHLIRRVGGQLAGGKRDNVVVKALQEINLELTKGDRVAIIGHNGAGKSTLLRILAGAYEPSSGEVRIEGTVTSLIDMAMGMDYELTGRENVVLRGVFLGMTFSEVQALMPDVANFAELGSYLDLPMRTYSTGMVLRLAFGISTAVRPDIILLDELISVGDARFAKKAQDRMEALLSSARILVLASHSPDLLRQYCNRGIKLHEGRVVADGSLEQVLAAHTG